MHLNELISYNHHNNGIAIYRFYNSRYFYKKISFNNKSNSILRNEYLGYKWYVDKTNLDFKPFLKKTQNNYKLIIPEFSGININSHNGISGNESYILKILEMYLSLWNKNNNYIHGDFALGNFIFSGSKIYIIDWEHFHVSDKNYFGFDFTHLIYICLKSVDFKISENSKLFLFHCFKKLKNLFKTSIFLEKPFQNSQKYMIENEIKFNLNTCIKNKFDLANENINLLAKLDQILIN